MADALDPRTADPRELMQALLPPARVEYVRAWEFLVDPNTPLVPRRQARTRAAAIADDHAVVAAFLRVRAKSLHGNDLQNAKHLADELERHAGALVRMGSISLIGLTEANDLRPESLGCGKRYRDPTKAPVDANAASRANAGRPATKPRDTRDRRDDKPFADRGPKVSRDALGTSKHDSPISEDLDPETRAKLEAMRAA
ncbi:MAG: hypothetical protein H7287_11635, partial [Thermoleophilia bacterium]|nr:hypothetical protein [Thermoleophilia bacterium]